MILVDMDFPGYSMDSISIDNELGGKTAVEHLIKLGHQRIGCIAGVRVFSPSMGRVDGYRLALKDAGMEIDENLILHNDLSLTGLQWLFCLTNFRLFSMTP